MKDIRYTEKKVDSAWKDSIKEEPGAAPAPEPVQPAPEQKKTEHAPRASAARDEDKRPPLDFAGFVSSLGMQAVMHMGDIPNPMTNKKEKNLAAAKELIDLLGILEEKTKGNLTKEEDGLLSKLLYDIRLLFIERSKK